MLIPPTGRTVVEPDHPCALNPAEYVAWGNRVQQWMLQKLTCELCPICHRWKFPDEICAEFKAMKAGGANP